MFVRLIWKDRPGPAAQPELRRPSLPGRRAASDLGVPPTDFGRMTRSLFDPHD